MNIWANNPAADPFLRSWKNRFEKSWICPLLVLFYSSTRRGEHFNELNKHSEFNQLNTCAWFTSFMSTYVRNKAMIYIQFTPEILRHRKNLWNVVLTIFQWVLYYYNALRARRAHLLFRLWTFSLCIHWKTKTKKFPDFIKKNLGFSKFNANQILLEANFWNFDHS